MLLSCVPSNKNDTAIPTIDIENELKNFQISKLSTYASSIHYVRLETNENCLITEGIKNIYLEDNKIFVHDRDPYLKVFGAKNGKFLYNIGARGQGPGELPHLAHVDINPFTKKILLSWGGIKNQFDFEGTFIRNIETPYVDSLEKISNSVISLDENLYAGAIATYGESQKNLIIIFNDKKEIISNLECHEHVIQPSNKSLVVWSPFDQGGSFYRANREVRYFRGFTDTIYSYRKEVQNFVPFFIINYGKYKSNLNFNKDAENKNLIKVRSIHENNRYVFLDFETVNASPEPFNDEVYINGRYYKFINHFILGIFDKKNKSFHFLKQPIPHIRGLENDIDNGIPFFVRNSSTENQLIDYYQAYKFLEYAEKLPNPNASFAKIASEISEEDNPIVIIAE